MANMTSCAFLVVGLAFTVPFGDTANAAPSPENAGLPAMDAKLIAAKLTESGPVEQWSLSLSLASSVPLNPDSIAVDSSEGETKLVSVDDDVVTLRFASRPAARAEHDVVVQVSASYGGGSLFERVGTTLYLVKNGGELLVSTGADYLARHTNPDGSSSDEVGLEMGPPELQGIPPWDNPRFSEADRAHFRKEFERKAALQADIARRSLVIPSEDAGDEALGSEGCATGTPGSVLALLALAAALSLRRRAMRALLTVSAIAVLAPAVGAKTVSGHIAFWDSRAGKSDAAGSRLRACINTNTTCSITSGPSCCHRPLIAVSVAVEQLGVIYDVDYTTQAGAFMFSFTGGNDNAEYQLLIYFDRPSMSPGMLRLTTAPPSPTASPYWMARKFYVTGPSTYIDQVVVNPVPIADTTSTRGNIASAWASVTETQMGISDARHRHNFGTSLTGPDDLVLIHYGGNKDYVNCSTSTIGVQVSSARGINPATSMGGIYHGRVVGCASGIIFENWYPVFPPYPARNLARSEGLAHANSYARLGGLLSRWSPNTAARADMAAALLLACVSESTNNANDAALWQNTYWSMWEFLDADPSGASGGTDSTQVTTTQLMDALLHFKGTPAASEPVYTYTPLPQDSCYQVDNENCNPGDVCMATLSQPVAKCHTGDPHGANIYDFAVALAAKSALMGGWPGIGNPLSTLDAAACLGGSHNIHPYAGGFGSD